MDTGVEPEMGPEVGPARAQDGSRNGSRNGRRNGTRKGTEKDQNDSKLGPKSEPKRDPKTLVSSMIYCRFITNRQPFVVDLSQIDNNLLSRCDKSTTNCCRLLNNQQIVQQIC